MEFGQRPQDGYPGWFGWARLWQGIFLKHTLSILGDESGRQQRKTTALGLGEIT